MALDDILGFHIRMAHGAVYRHFNETFGTIGLTQKQTSVLWLVSERPGISQTDIAGHIRDRSGDHDGDHQRPARSDLLQRRASTTDRRRQTLYLTSTGTAALGTAPGRRGGA